MAERVARERRAENGEQSFDVAVVAGGVGTKKSRAGRRGISQ